MKQLFFLLFFCLTVAAQNAQARTVRVFVIGNSFSRNATRYLPQLAKAGGHKLVIGRAELGGHSLEKHWSYVQAAEANPDDKKGKPYGGKSLRQLLSEGSWDIVTLQQNSVHSGDVETYRPYAQKFRDFILALQPNARIALHQTWAYRSDAKAFGQIAGNQKAQSQREMWEKSRAAYHAIAAELGARVIPVGDAFWKAGSDPLWEYKKDPVFDFQNPVFPALPDQKNSLHAGYAWQGQTSIYLDANHANAAGCYLGGLVWYGFLFGESSEKPAFSPREIPVEFAAHLRKVAGQSLQELYPAFDGNSDSQPPVPMN